MEESNGKRSTNVARERTLKSQFTCIFCNKTYGSKRSLLRHLDIDHLLNEEFSCDMSTYKSKVKSNFKKHSTKVNVNNGNVPKHFSCSYCNTRFSLKENLQRHEIKAHGIQRYVSSLQRNRKCPLCPYTSISKTKNEINLHFSKVHELTVRQDEYSFDSIDEFSRWKDDLERRTLTFYVIRKYSSITIYYECHWKGYFMRNGVNRRLKTDGSCKINGHCPSEIRVKISSSGGVSVVYVPTHVGHRDESRFARLNSMERQLIASQLLQKPPHKEILKRLKNLMSSSNLKRLHLTRKKNIVNIEKNLNLYANEKHQLIPAVARISPVEEHTQSDQVTQLHSMDELSIEINQDTQLYSMDEFSIDIDQDTQFHSVDEFRIDFDTQLHSVDEFSIDIDEGNQIGLHSVDEFNSDIDETFKMEPISEEIIVSDFNTDNETYQMEPISKEVIVSEINTNIANKKTEIKEMFDILLNKITTNEQIEFVLSCVKELITAVDAMQRTALDTIR